MKKRPRGAARIRGGEIQAFPVGERSEGRRRRHQEELLLPPSTCITAFCHYRARKRPQLGSTTTTTIRQPRTEGREGLSELGYHRRRFGSLSPPSPLLPVRRSCSSSGFICRWRLRIWEVRVRDPTFYVRSCPAVWRGVTFCFPLPLRS